MTDEIIIAIISACGGTVIGGIIEFIKNRRTESTRIENAIKILLRRELNTQQEHYVSAGSITHIGLQEFEDTLAVYESLIGSNGFVETLANNVRSLEVKD